VKAAVEDYASPRESVPVRSCRLYSPLLGRQVKVKRRASKSGPSSTNLHIQVPSGTHHNNTIPSLDLALTLFILIARLSRLETIDPPGVAETLHHIRLHLESCLPSPSWTLTCSTSERHAANACMRQMRNLSRRTPICAHKKLLSVSQGFFVPPGPRYRKPLRPRLQISLEDNFTPAGHPLSLKCRAQKFLVATLLHPHPSQPLVLRSANGTCRPQRRPSKPCKLRLVCRLLVELGTISHWYVKRYSTSGSTYTHILNRSRIRLRLPPIALESRNPCRLAQSRLWCAHQAHHGIVAR
jgi:hypothetical protein